MEPGVRNRARAGGTGFCIALSRLVSGIWRSQVCYQSTFVLCLVLRTAVATNEEYLNVHWAFNKTSLLNVTVLPELHFDLLTSITFLLGVFIVAICGPLILNSLYWLYQIQSFVGHTLLCVRDMWPNWQNSPVVVATCTSIVNTVWFAYFVREVWIVKLSVMIQVLQAIPGIIIIIDAILCGWLVCAESALSNVQNPIIIHAEYQTDKNSHRGANIVLVMYSFFNVLVAIKSTSKGTITQLYPLLRSWSSSLDATLLTSCVVLQMLMLAMRMWACTSHLLHLNQLTLATIQTIVLAMVMMTKKLVFQLHRSHHNHPMHQEKPYMNNLNKLISLINQTFQLHQSHQERVARRKTAPLLLVTTLPTLGQPQK